MKLLVSGCSLSSGWGFDVNNKQLNWPEQLASRLDATLVNVSVTGYDNPGIFMNFMQELVKEDFDLCLLQVTALERIILSPTWHGSQLCNRLNISNGLLSESDYHKWYKNFLLLNQSAEHWHRLCKIINILQELAYQKKSIRFINGLLDWDYELFNNPSKSMFINRLLDVNNLPDDDIDKFRNIVYNQTKGIDLNLWINPFNSFKNMQIDNISVSDSHPGIASHLAYTDLIFNYLKDTSHT